MARDLFQEAGITPGGEGRDLFAEAGITPPKPVKTPAGFLAGRTAKDLAGDALVMAGKAAVGLPQAAVGIADLATGGHVGKTLDDAGIKFNETQKILDTWYSDPQQEANKKVREAQGFIPTISAALDNPSVIATSVGESVPQMLGGAGIARTIMKGAPKAAAWLAGAAGEGVIGTGSAAEQLRGGNKDGLLTGQQQVAAIGSGLGTAAFGAAGGKLAQKFKFGDIDTMLAQGGANATAAGEARKGFLRQVAEGGISEGAFEELPQSLQEQMWQNWGSGKPIMEGTGNAAALGMLTGMAMGGAAGGYNVMSRPPEATDPAPVAPPIPATNIPGGQDGNPSALDAQGDQAESFVAAGSAGDPQPGVGIGPGRSADAGSPVPGAGTGVPVGTASQPDAALTPNGETIAPQPEKLASQESQAPSAQAVAEVLPGIEVAEAPIDEITAQPVVTDIDPRMEVIDSRLAVIAAQMKTRSDVVQASLQREAAGLMQRRNAIDPTAQAPAPAPQPAQGVDNGTQSQETRQAPQEVLNKGAAPKPDAAPATTGNTGVQSVTPEFESEQTASAIESTNFNLPEGYSVSPVRGNYGFNGSLAIQHNGNKVGFIDAWLDHQTGEVRINKVELDKDHQGKRIAKLAYIGLNNALLSTGQGVLGSDTRSMTQSALNMWKSLVRDGLARERVDGRIGYEFLPSQNATTPATPLPAKASAPAPATQQASVDAGESVDYGGDTREVGISVGRIYEALRNAPNSTNTRVLPVDQTLLDEAFRQARDVGITIEPRVKTNSESSQVWDITTPAGNSYLAYLSPAGRGNWKAVRTEQQPGEPVATQPSPSPAPATPSAKPATGKKPYFSDYAKQRIGRVPDVGTPEYAQLKAEYDAIEPSQPTAPAAAVPVRVEARKPAESKRAAPRELDTEGRAKDGKPINPGDVFRTSSGRETTPYPKQKGEKYASQWTIDNAVAEAESRGDRFNAPMFKNTKPLKGGELTTADREGMLEYLFGQQPKVVPSILKPLVSAPVQQADKAKGKSGKTDKVEIRSPEWESASGKNGTKKKQLTAHDSNGERIARLVIYRDPDGTIDVSDIAVKESEQRKGVATQLIDAAFRETGAPHLTLSTGTTEDGTALVGSYGERLVNGRRVVARPERLGKAVSEDASTKAAQPETAFSWDTLYPNIKEAEKAIKANNLKQVGVFAKGDKFRIGAKTSNKKPESNNLIGRIKQLGGIHTRYRSDVIGDKTGAPGLFSNTGKGLDDLATMLKADGFDIDTETVDGGVDALTGMIRRATDGDTILNHAGQEEAQKREAESNYRENLKDDIEGLGGKPGRTMSTKQLEAMLAKLRSDLEEKAGKATLAVVDDVSDELDNIPFDEPGNMTAAQVAAILGMDEDEINGITGIAVEESSAAPEQPVPGATGDRAQTDRGAAGAKAVSEAAGPVVPRPIEAEQRPEARAQEGGKGDGAAFGLTGQTPAEVKAEEDARAAKARQEQEAADKAEAEAKKARIKKEDADRKDVVMAEREAAKKAEVDAAVDGFQLGQEAPAPVSKKTTTDDLAGQGDIFSQPASTEATRSKPKTRIAFDGITGPTGARLTGYEWAWKPYAYVDRLGEDREGRESDWDNAETNVETGRDIVHKFTVEQAGNEQTVSLETALQLLGFAESGSLSVKGVANTAKKVAKIKMAIAELEPVAVAYDKAKSEVDATPYPPITVEGIWARMGDAMVRRRSDDAFYVAGEKKTLELSWKEKRMADRGFKGIQSPHDVIADLNAKLARAERKMSEAVTAAANTPTPAQKAPDSAEAPAWHTKIPDQGIEIIDGDEKINGATNVIHRIATEAFDSVTRDQMMAMGTMYAHVLPAKDGRHGIVRLLPDDQKAPDGWKLLNGEVVRIGFLSKEQVVAKLSGWLRSAPILGEPKAKPATKKAEAKPAQEQPKQDIKTPRAAHEALFTALRNGESTLADYRAGLDALLANEAEIRAELEGMTKEAIFKDFRSIQYRYKNEKKATVVSAAYDDLLTDFTLGRGLSYSFGRDVRKAQSDALAALVERTTQADLDEFAAKVKAARAESEARLEKMIEAVKDPKTVEDFETYIRAKKSKGMSYEEARMTLTPEQRALYDATEGARTRDQRKARADQQAATISAPGEAVGASEIIKTRHTKLGHDLWQFTLERRVPPDEFKSLVAQAKRMGGDYSSYKGNGAIPGWQFRTEEAAKVFRALVMGDATAAKEVVQARRDAFKDDRSQSGAERLNEMADNLEERADASLGQVRKANTARRARFAASAESAANADKALAKTMRNLAGAIKAGTAKFLDRVRQKAQVEMLRGFVHNAKYSETVAKYKTYQEQENHRWDKPTGETADYAKFPQYTAYRSDLARLGRELQAIDGAKNIGASLVKLADDVTDAYLAFAKENLNKVSAFSVNGGKPAILPSKGEAEMAINRSGYKGKAVVLPFKRGQNIIILSPQAAREKGIWQGDDDKRITLTDEFGAEIVAKVATLGKYATSMPYTFDSVHTERARLSGMGIETPNEFRAALREFIGLSEQPAEKNKIKELERAMIGRAKDGLDFFPTPAGVAKDMVDAADIKEGMAVLEPSAGMGHIAEAIRDAGVDPDVVEMSNARSELLEAKGFNVVGRDFMDINPRGYTFGDTYKTEDGTEGVMRGLGGLGSNRVRLVVDGDERTAIYVDRDSLTPVRKNGYNSGYDRIVMNPPFSDRRDIEHVRHAYELLKPGGRLVAIMGEGSFFGSDKKATEFRDWLEAHNGTSEKLDEGTFMDQSLPVNTGVNARMVVVDKPESDSGTRLSRAANQPGIALRDLQAVATRVARAMKNLPRVHVLESPAKLDADNASQKRLLDFLEANGAMSDVEGATHDGEIYLFASGLRDEFRAEQVLAEHEVTHYGLRGVFGADLDHILQSIWVNNGQVRKSATALRDKFGMKSNVAAVEEVLADMSPAELVKLKGWRRLVGALRNWFDAHGFSGISGRLDALLKSGLDDQMKADLMVAEVVTKSRDWVRNPGGVMAGTMLQRTGGDQFAETEERIGGERAYNQAKESGRTELTYRQWVQVRTPNFKRWWGYDWEQEAIDYGITHERVVGRGGGEAGKSDTASQDAGVSGRRADVDGNAQIRNGAPRGFAFSHPGTGEPRIFFHGTRDEFTEFDVNHPNKLDAGWLGKGHYVSSDKRIAETYANNLKHGNGDPVIMDLFVRPVNPFILPPTAKRYIKNYSPEKLEKFNSELRKHRYRGTMTMFLDGLIEMAIFDANSLKSATDNTGAFSESNDIRLSRASQPNLPGAPGQQQAQQPAQTAIPLQGGAGGNRASWDMPEPSRLDNIIYKWQDKHIDLKRAVQAIKQAVALPEWADAYLQEELFHGRVAKRTQDFVDRELSAVLDSMLASGVTQDELNKHLHARHAEEANELIRQRDPNMQDAGSGMTDADARSYMAGLPAAKRAALDAVAAQVDAILEGTRKLYVTYGLESADTVQGWRDMFKHYVPLMREDHDGGMGTGQGFSIKGKEAKHRTGSTAEVVDILANIALQREKAITRGEKNRVSVSLMALAKMNPNPDVWAFGPVAERRYNENTGLVEYRVNNTWKNRDEVVTAKVKTANGSVREVGLILNQRNDRAMRLAEAMKNLDVAQLEGALGVSAKVTRYFSSINTQYNPVFGAINLARDLQAGILNLNSTPLSGRQTAVLRHVPSALVGIYQDARADRKGQTAASQWAQLWEEFTSEGGQTGYRDLYRTSTDRAKAIERTLNPDAWMDSGIGKALTLNGALRETFSGASPAVKWIFDWLSDYNLAMENAVRISAYKVAVDQGMSKQRAASIAKNLTVNFNRKGQSGMQAGAMFAFFNASMQGTARIAETAFDMDGGDIKTARLSTLGKRIVQGGLAIGVIQALALMAAGFDDDEPPEFVKERNLIIPIKPVTGGRNYIAIPMPLGFHVIPNVARMATEYALGNGKNGAEMMASVLGMVLEAFNPMGGAGLSIQTVLPTVFDPFAALAENRDWTGKPIAKENMNSLAPIPGHARAKDVATYPARLAAEAVNYISGGDKYTPGVLSPTPDQIDYLWGQLTGGVGREANKLATTATAIVTGEDLPTHKIPLLGRMYGDADAQSGQAGKFYDNLKSINLHEMRLKGMRADGLNDEARAYIGEHGEAALIGMGNAAESQIRTLNKVKRNMIASGADKELIKAVEERIKAAMRTLNQRVSEQREND